ITHASALDFVDKIKNTFTEAFNCQDYDINITTPVVTTHTGKGAIGLVVVREK
ncbi:fatty acid-binding protein DegV, partial [Staphylococcus warneri]